MNVNISRTKISLNSFYVFNSTLCQCEGEEDKKILFYQPKENDLNTKVKNVGFSEAIIKVTGNFLNDNTKSVNSLNTKKTLQVFYQPENEFWMVMILNVPYERKIQKDGSEQIEYFGHDVQEKVFLEILKQSYSMFRLFHNTFASNMAISTDYLINLLDQFYTQYLLNINLANGDILDCLNCCIQYFPVNHFNFLKIINFVNMLETHFPTISNCIFLYKEQIIYSAISPVDLYSITEYLNVNLYPKARLRDPRNDFNQNGKFLTGPSYFDPCTDVPELFILNQKTNQHEKYFIIIFNALNTTLCMMVKEYDSKNLDFFNEIRSYVGPQLAAITKEIEDSMKQVQQLNSTSSDKSNLSDLQNHQKYLYFNDLNRRFYATFYNDLSTNNNRQIRSSTIPVDVMNLLIDLYDMDAKDERNNKIIENDKECIMKTYADYWIVKRTSNSRHLYLIMNKNSTLIDIAEESKKIMDNIIKNVYFNKH